MAEIGIPQLVAIAVALVAGLVVAVLFLKPKSKPTLDPSKWQYFPLTQKTKVSPNTSLYRFSLPRQDAILGLPIGQHISVQAEINGKNVQRSYTPVSSDDDKGFFELMIKTYEQGNISKYMDNLKIGDKLTVKGPKGQMTYTPYLALKIGMIAGGTGITPMLQIIRAILKNPLDLTVVSLLYANVNESDILLKKELDELAEKHPQRFSVYYVLNNAPEGWKGGVGFVTKEMMEEKLPKPANDIKILLCGPPPMIKAMKGNLEGLGYDPAKTISKKEDQVFAF